MYKKIYFYSTPSFLYWISKSPALAFRYVWCKFKHRDFLEYLEKYSIVNELRRTCLYYGEKDSQNRDTISCKYALKDQVVSVRLRLLKKARRTDYEAFKETLETHTCTVSNIRYEKGYACFDVIQLARVILEYRSDNVQVSIGTGVEGLEMWNWTAYPHLLLIGETGQGKSTFIRYLLNGLFSAGHEVWCIDGKVIDYTLFQDSFKSYTPNSAQNKAEILKVVKRFRSYMKRRLEDMQKLGIYEYYRCKDFKPKFLLIDEWVSIVETMSKQERQEFDECITEIILLGRAVGYILIGTLQRGDTKYISGALRDNFQCRIVVGNASDTSYRMIYEQSLTGFEKGKAWCMLGNELKVIAIPFYQKVIDNKVIKEQKKKLSEEEQGCNS